MSTFCEYKSPLGSKHNSASAFLCIAQETTGTFEQSGHLCGLDLWISVEFSFSFPGFPSKVPDIPLHFPLFTNQVYSWQMSHTELVCTLGKALNTVIIIFWPFKRLFSLFFGLFWLNFVDEAKLWKLFLCVCCCATKKNSTKQAVSCSA